MMTILTPSSWTTFLGCVGSMKTSWLLPHTPLWVSHSSAHLHKSIVTTMDGKLQAFDLFVMLYLNLPASLELAHRNLPHTEISRRPWVSTQSVIDNAYHTMGSLDPSRYIFYALWVDQLDSLFNLVLIDLSQDQSLGNSLNSTLVDTNSPWNQHMYSKKSLWTKPSNITQGNH